MSQNLDLVWILKSLGLSRLYDEIAARDGTIIREDKLISLDLSDLNIKRVPADLFNNCDSLRAIDLSLNKIGSLPSNLLKGVPRLQNLNLSGNRLTSIPNNFFNHSEEIETLNLSGNQLTDLGNALKKTLKLKELNIANNSVSFFPNSWLDNVDKLEKIDLHGNYLGEGRLEMKFPKSLKYINLSDMKITKVKSTVFSSNGQLEELNLSFNLLKELPDNIFEQIEKLRILWISNNQLEKLPKSIIQCKELTHLVIAENRLQEIPSLNELSKLEYLIANGNNLKSFNFEALSKHPSIKEIWLGGNNSLGNLAVNLFSRDAILEVCKQYQEESNVLQTIHEILETLNVNVTPLTILNRDKTVVKEGRIISLDLSGLNIEDIQELLANPKLIDSIENLNFASNNIKRIPEDWGGLEYSIKSLDLSGNPILTLPKRFAESFKNLVKLNLKNTNLPNCWNRDFSDEFDLEEFRDEFGMNFQVILKLNEFMEKERIDAIAVHTSQKTTISNGNLISLDISDNRINSNVIEQLKFVGLKRLIARNCELLEIPKLSGLPNLELLDLSFNKISFGEIKHDNLLELIIIGNNLEKIKIKAQELETLDLSSNRINGIEDLSMDTPNLEELILCKNKIKEMKCITHPNLKILDVSGNPIESFCGDIANALPKLRQLNLKDTELPPDLAKQYYGREDILMI